MYPVGVPRPSCPAPASHLTRLARGRQMDAIFLPQHLRPFYSGIKVPPTSSAGYKISLPFFCLFRSLRHHIFLHVYTFCPICCLTFPHALPYLLAPIHSSHIASPSALYTASPLPIYSPLCLVLYIPSLPPVHHLDSSLYIARTAQYLPSHY